MRPLSGGAVILTLLTDLSSALHAVTGSSCFFQTETSGISSLFELPSAGIYISLPPTRTYSTGHETLHKKKSWSVQMIPAAHRTEWPSCVNLEYSEVYLCSKQPQTLSLSARVSCSCCFTKTQQLQIFICLAAVLLPANQSFLWRITGRQWKPSLGNRISWAGDSWQ